MGHAMEFQCQIDNPGAPGGKNLSAVAVEVNSQLWITMNPESTDRCIGAFFSARPPGPATKETS